MSGIVNRFVDKFSEFVLKNMIDTYTKIDYEGPDYFLTINIGEGKWVFEVTPKTDYGTLAMKKIYERHTTEELSKG